MWAYALMEQHTRLDDAVALLRFGTALYPTSANLFDSLGEALEKKRDTAAANTELPSLAGTES